MTIYLLNTALAKLVAIVKEGYYDELIELVKTDANFRESLLEIDKLVNVGYAHSTRSFNEEFLFSLKDYELVALIRSFTALDGAVNKFTFEAKTPVPSLLGRLRDLNYENFDELVDWLYKKRSNKFILGDWGKKDEAKSLKEYLLLKDKDRLLAEIYRLQNNLKSIDNKINNPDIATNNLKDAIKRKDWRSFDALIKQGADINTFYYGNTLSKKIEEVKREAIKSGKIYRLELEESIYLTDKNEKALRITIGDLTLNADELNEFHYVTIASNYDNGFGFSHLHRFEDNKDYEKLKSFCDSVLIANEVKFLSLNLPNRWKVIVTPKVKGDAHAQKQLCQSIMGDVLSLSQEIGTGPIRLLITQYRYMHSYREEQISGVFEAINQLRNSSFEKLELIHFEVDVRFRDRFYKHLRAALFSKK